MSVLDRPAFEEMDSAALEKWFLEVSADPHAYNLHRAEFLRRSSQLKLNMAAAMRADTSRFRAKAEEAPPPPGEQAPPVPVPPGDLTLEAYKQQRAVLTGIPDPRKKTPSS